MQACSALSRYVVIIVNQLSIMNDLTSATKRPTLNTSHKALFSPFQSKRSPKSGVIRKKRDPPSSPLLIRSLSVCSQTPTPSKHSLRNSSPDLGVSTRFVKFLSRSRLSCVCLVSFYGVSSLGPLLKTHTHFPLFLL